jgi:hypothetical protein
VTRTRTRCLPTGRGSWAAALAVAWQVFVCEPSHAAPPEAPTPHRVLIVVDEPSDQFMDLVKAEVSAVRGVEIVAHATVGSLDAAARAEKAEVAIRKVTSGNGVEVWMSDVTSGRSLLRQLIVDESPEGPDRSLIALQTAELLRTSFFPKHAMSAPDVVAPRTPPGPTAAAATPTAPSSRQSALQAGIGFLYSRGGVSPALQAWLSYEHRWHRHFGVVLDVSAPLARGSVSAPEGSANIGAVLAGGGVYARFESGGGRMFITTSLGGAFAAIVSSGQPAQDLVGSSTTVYTGLTYVRLGGGFYPTGWLGLGVAGVLGTTTSRVRIQFTNRDVGEWGMPIAGAIVYGEGRWQ